jgi:hypothetical protein
MIGGPIINYVVGCFIYNLIKSTFQIDIVDAIFIIFLPMITLWDMTGLSLNIQAQNNKTKLSKQLENNVFNYLENNLEEKELKEFLLKVKLIELYNQFPIANLAIDFEKYLSYIENDTIEDKELNNITSIIMTDFSNYIEKNKLLLEKNISELKTELIQTMANQLKQEREHNKKLNQFIANFAENDETFLFQKAKTLKASL